ncbi:2'-5'-oligoadenylate synthase 2-like [Haliotis rufescens]|uniref:2'-5'-oligoadenylate synthase 2-like n=1 Tax=Haliotis rufescens TaxID=6454 RepID=UPI001EAFE343|nr:2'-5'-oligoadenylate synthase 2-like [Haliotis rufescens]
MSSSGPEPLIRRMKMGQTIQQFMAEWGPFDSNACDAMVERIIQFLQQNVFTSVISIVKGGSIGKNTRVYTTSDVDLFVFINNLTSIQELKAQTRHILHTIRARLDSAAWHSSAGVIDCLESTTHSIKMRLTCSDVGQQHMVEIFPACDILRYKNEHDVYMDMRDLPDADRDYYSACLARIQIDFIRQAPSQVRSLIRILKYWLKEEVNVDAEITSYYLIELLVMHRWQRAGHPTDFDMLDWFEEIMIQLFDLKSLGIEWANKYTTTKYRAVPPRPFVMDPANPFNNVLPEPRYRQQLMLCAKAVVGRSQALRKYLNHGSAPIIEGMGRGQTLQQFIQDTIQPSSDFRQQCDRVVERVTYFLQHHTPLSVSMVVRGGSLGRSTNVHGQSDVDLVVFIKDVNSVQQLEAKMENILHNLHNAFKRHWTEFAGTLEFEPRSDRCLHFKLSCGASDHIHNVDILPAYNILGVKTCLEAFNEMKDKTEKQRRFYSPCFILEQKELVKTATVKIKNLVRLVKYWANKVVSRQRKVMRSYFLEIVVISLWKNRGSPSDFNTNDWFKDVMTQLADLTSLRILWPERFNVALYYDINETKNPVVLDPANPYNNLEPRAKHHSLVMTCAQNVLHRLEAS